MTSAHRPPSPPDRPHPPAGTAPSPTAPPAPTWDNAPPAGGGQQVRAPADAPGARQARDARTGPRGVPTATYRFQVRPEFPFAAVAAAVPYLARLGVSHLHLSPVLEAVPGSAHGYDVTDHGRVREELGGEAGLRALAETARAHGLGLVLDIVPNHMAVPVPAELNRPLWDVLRHGPESEYAHWFDIDWQAGGGRLLMPFLGGPLGEEMQRLTVDRENGALHYGEQRFPLRAAPAAPALPPDGRADPAEVPQDGLPGLLDAQHYRLAWWRLARSDLNYRRFFTIPELIGLRTEHPEVFEATHTTVVRLVREGVVTGLRVDHPDGLADPAGYFTRLSERTGAVWTVAEKILGAGERLPDDWRVAGTTGYDALRHVDGVLTSSRGAAELTEHYRAFTGAPPDLGGDWAATVRRAAYHVITHDLAAECGRLVRTAERLCREQPELRLRDHARWALRTAVVELLAGLPVYRPYVPAGGPPSPADEAVLASAAETATAAFAVDQEAEAVRTVRELALGRLGGGPDADDFRVRFAQVAAAVRAKSVEDAAFYRYTPLLSACEVGGDPSRPALSPEVFHAFCARLQRDWPYTGTVLSTHDTKRSADVRARIAALTESPRAWMETLAVLTELTAADGGCRAPDPHAAWSVWQLALGMGGAPGRDRLLAAVLKSVREAGLHTSWLVPDPAYEAAVERFVLAGPCGAARAELAARAAALAPRARVNALAGTLLHLTMPGVPELYQGTETEYLALVDPDNRALPQLPAERLAALDEGAAAAGTGDEKLRLTAAALRLRRARPEWFGAEGEYRPLTAEGPAAGHCLAFVRGGRVITAVTRLPGRLAEDGGWRDTGLPLPAGGWRDLLTGRAHRGRAAAEALFADFPVALLVRPGDGA
ncbi:malto-oligosyltrehalose synthase [Streptomyces aidingensis]|uniref:(1->4)-alpha-D-glucan 1-alpha-D-glucosylmutase n=1 Tax=Streptomyces aidingensis TaxID=910347 RepID=A0A1I1INA9_9ACTN|nr:malto-oligosyltrehalose synthase [Streptomyces aidingensis]SFC37685.1 (1->4)-alpha-D-glucan 1-alpha-D-glucosylmutase [Streptomyces aidingensis]